MVFVTGDSYGAVANIDYATLAYSAATGAELWLQRYDGPASQDDFAVSVAVSPTGGRLFVTGWTIGLTSGGDYTTIAYSS